MKLVFIPMLIWYFLRLSFSITEVSETGYFAKWPDLNFCAAIYKLLLWVGFKPSLPAWEAVALSTAPRRNLKSVGRKIISRVLDKIHLIVKCLIKFYNTLNIWKMFFIELNFYSDLMENMFCVPEYQNSSSSHFLIRRWMSKKKTYLHTLHLWII